MYTAAENEHQRERDEHVKRDLLPRKPIGDVLWKERFQYLHHSFRLPQFFAL